jgi:hypothetical protein
MSPVRLTKVEGGHLDETPATTWAPISLADVIGGVMEEPPSILTRTDGHCLLYPGRVHALQAEPESLKSWLALKACAALLRRFEAVVYFDFEDSPSAIVGRLNALGIPDQVIVDCFSYVRPDEPLTDQAIADLDKHTIDRKPSLAIIDGLTEAFSRQGLNPLDNGDVAAWLDLLPRRLACAGTAVLTLDHVVKDPNSVAGTPSAPSTSSPASTSHTAFASSNHSPADETAWSP